LLANRGFSSIWADFGARLFARAPVARESAREEERGGREEEEGRGMAEERGERRRGRRGQQYGDTVIRIRIIKFKIKIAAIFSTRFGQQFSI